MCEYGKNNYKKCRKYIISTDFNATFKWVYQLDQCDVGVPSSQPGSHQMTADWLPLQQGLLHSLPQDHGNSLVVLVVFAPQIEHCLSSCRCLPSRSSPPTLTHSQDAQVVSLHFCSDLSELASLT